LSVPTISYWLSLIQLVLQVLEVLVLNVFHIEPIDGKVTSYILLLVPLDKIRVWIHISNHLCYSTKFTALVQTEEQKYWIIPVRHGELKYLAQFFISFFCAWPDLIYKRLRNNRYKIVNRITLKIFSSLKLLIT
jgi:hypothetical protein